MYALPKAVAELRTKMRQEFERHRFVQQLPVVDMLLFQSDAEFQETLNYWKTLPHVMKYFRAEEDPAAKLPANFMQGFLEVSSLPGTARGAADADSAGPQLRLHAKGQLRLHTKGQLRLHAEGQLRLHAKG